jgi:subtilisin-like proprotein convertase family protein
MTSFKALALAIATLAAVTVRAEEPVVQNYWFNSGFADSGNIPDGNIIGWSDARVIDDWSEGLVISDVKVTLSILGGYNGDLYAYLAHESGFAVLLNRAGRTEDNLFGYADAGLSITLDDNAATDIHLYGGNGGNLLTGTWQPDGRNADPATVTDLSARGAMLFSFAGGNPNGVWTLFVSDLSVGGESAVQGWGLAIAAVPEPGAIALALLGAGLLLLFQRHRQN